MLPTGAELHVTVDLTLTIAKSLLISGPEPIHLRLRLELEEESQATEPQVKFAPGNFQELGGNF